MFYRFKVKLPIAYLFYTIVKKNLSACVGRFELMRVPWSTFTLRAFSILFVCLFHGGCLVVITPSLSPTTAVVVTIRYEDKEYALVKHLEPVFVIARQTKNGYYLLGEEEAAAVRARFFAAFSQ